MKPSAKTSKRKLKAYPTFVLVLIFLSVMAFFFTLNFAVESYKKLFPDVSILASQYPVAVKKDGKKILYNFSKEKPVEWLSYPEIPAVLVSAILTSEDASFFEHNGYSVEGMRFAFTENMKNKRLGVKKPLRGGSTITQQVIKNIFLTQDKTLIRKVRELLLSLDLEKHLSKRKILEVYLNTVEWGPNVFGATEAIRYHFSKSPNELTEREAAILAFLLPNPIKYSKSIKGEELTEFANRKVESILAIMHGKNTTIETDHSEENQSEFNEESNLNLNTD